MSHRRINMPVEAELVVLSESSWKPPAVTGEADLENYLSQRFARTWYEVLVHGIKLRNRTITAPSVAEIKHILKVDGYRYTMGRGFANHPTEPLKPDHVVDAWSVRAQFLSWSPEDWRGFADTLGVPDVGLLSEEDFASWQELLKEAMVSAPSQWPSL